MAIPPVSALTTPDLFDIMVSRLKDTLPTSIPRCLKSCCAMCSKWELCNNDFDGIQPTFKHVPPRLGSFSIDTVWNKFNNRQIRLHLCTDPLKNVVQSIVFYIPLSH